MLDSSTGKWLVAASLLLAFASPASAATDTATLLVAQLDSVAAFCSQRLPANKDQYKAFVDGILSGAAPKEIARIRDTQDYERAREWDTSQLNASRNNAAGTCSGLTALTEH
jgi:hypothetical protein